MRPNLVYAVLSACRNVQDSVRCYLNTIFLVAFLIGVPQRGYATDWVPISGQIQFEGAPVCALVLANGQHIFSCNGNGAYNLTVPLDTNGTITLFAFASGFAPFKQVLTSGEAAIYNVGMVRSDTSRELEITQVITPGTDGWVNISGSVKYNGAPVCAMALANGQHMFTCGDNLGRFTMEAPLDSSGKITLFNFASGFSPSRMSISGSDGVTGQWVGTVSSTVVPCAGELSVSLQQVGTAVTGLMEYFNPQAGFQCMQSVVDILTGTIEGNTITFGLGNYLGFTFLGTINGSSMSGTWNWPANADRGTWMLTR